MPTGGHGLKFAEPRLVLSMRRTGALVSITLPLDLKEQWELSQPDGSRPTAVLPSPADVAARSQKAMQVRGPRPAWEPARLAELLAIGGDRVSPWGKIKSDGDYQTYRKQLNQMLMVPPRYWEGWDIQE